MVRAEVRQTASLLYEREELRVYMSAGARAAGTLAQRAAGERAARRTACLVVPATLCALVGVLQQRQHERHTAEMERLQGALLAELVASEDKRERVLALAPQLAASAGARSADCTSLAAALRELDSSPLPGSQQQQLASAAAAAPLPAVKVTIW